MRRYDIDSIRVLVFLLLIFYHVGMFFVSGWDWHIKNSITYDWMRYPMYFVNQWRLPLLFVISGMGTYFNVSKNSGWGFARERLTRLFIPLVVGIIFIVPSQVYFERLDKLQFFGNYFDFWPSKAFIGVYPTGNFSWHHLWFLPYLLLFSLALAGIFLYFRNNPQTWIVVAVKNLSGRNFGLFVLAIPLVLWELILRPRFPSTHALVGDWYNLVNYCTLFFYGYLFMTQKDSFWENVTKNRRQYLFAGVCLFLILLQLPRDGFPGNMELMRICRGLNELAWILAIIGYGAIYLNRPSKTLAYANEAVYPFYILHQTIIIILGFYLINVELSLPAKFTIMLVGTFGISLLIYEYGIRRNAWIRPLFGLKRKCKCTKNY